MSRPASRPGIRFVAIALALLALAAPARLSAQAGDKALPELTAPVNDFANVIDSQNAAKLDELIRALHHASGDTVVVATVPSLDPYGDIDMYGVKLFENRGRGIGEKGKDNGVLVLMSLKERKVRIEVGYDLEQFITDGYSGETIRDYMLPEFRSGNYGAGLLAGVQHLVSRIAEARHVDLGKAATPAPAPRKTSGWGLWFILGIILLFIVFGGGGPAHYVGRRRWGGSGWSGWTSGIGSFGGGGSGGFGGGFGGFGGGGSGGGGASGGW